MTRDWQAEAEKLACDWACDLGEGPQLLLAHRIHALVLSAQREAREECATLCDNVAARFDEFGTTGDSALATNFRARQHCLRDAAKNIRALALSLGTIKEEEHG